MTRKRVDISKAHRRRCTREDGWAVTIIFAVFAIIVICLATGFMLRNAKARDVGQWAQSDPVAAEWYRGLMQPDDPTRSCCGESDAYWADVVETDKDGNLVAVITDDRPDEPLRRPHVPIGTKVIVPRHKIKWDRGNPVGHIVIFMGSSRHVYCYVQNGGV